MGVEVNIRVELPVELAEHVSYATGEEGEFDSVEAYVRELIRRDMEDIDWRVVESHLPELRRAFASSPDDAIEMDLETFLQRAKARRQ